MEDDTDSRGDGREAGASGGTPDSLLPYDQWMEDALRGVIARALIHTIEEGLPGGHHFYVTFRTGYPGVVLPPRLLQKYPEEMTIVLQHQFDKLHVDEAAGLFGVSLSFGGVLSALTIPLAAVSAFVDPYVQYGLRFRVRMPETPMIAAPEGVPVPSAAESEEGAATPQVVSLDAFRRKRD